MLNCIFKRTFAINIGLLAYPIEFVAVYFCKIVAIFLSRTKPLNANNILLIKRSWACGNNVHESVCSYIKSSSSSKQIIEFP